MKIMGNDGATSETAEANPSESEQQQANTADAEAGQSSGAAVAGAAGGSAVNKQDIQRKMSGGLDKLDSLISKTEYAHHSMAQQNKQMKSFLQ